MLSAKRRPGFTLVELLVVIAIIGILAGLLLPVLGTVRNHARASATQGMMGSLRAAIDMYFKDEGTYPPDTLTSSYSGLDKPSETLYFFLVGENISSPDSSRRQFLRSQRLGYPVYMDFQVNSLADYDNDKNYEILDAFGNPWVYVRPPFPGIRKPSDIGNPAENFRPWHNRNAYDLISVGADGKTGRASTWRTHGRLLELGLDSPMSFYRQATREEQAGLRSAGGFSADDISNF